MIEINLSSHALDINGNVLNKDITMGESLANVLVGGTKGEALKFYDWAISLAKTGKITVDEHDFKKIKLFVEESENIFIILKAQLIRKLDECKAAHDEKAKKK